MAGDPDGDGGRPWQGRVVGTRKKSLAGDPARDGGQQTPDTRKTSLAGDPDGDGGRLWRGRRTTLHDWPAPTRTCLAATLWHSLRATLADDSDETALWRSQKERQNSEYSGTRKTILAGDPGGAVDDPGSDAMSPSPPAVPARLVRGQAKVPPRQAVRRPCQGRPQSSRFLRAVSPGQGGPPKLFERVPQSRLPSMVTLTRPLQTHPGHSQQELGVRPWWGRRTSLAGTATPHNWHSPKKLGGPHSHKKFLKPWRGRVGSCAVRQQGRQPSCFSEWGATWRGRPTTPTKTADDGTRKSDGDWWALAKPAWWANLAGTPLALARTTARRTWRRLWQWTARTPARTTLV